MCFSKLHLFDEKSQIGKNLFDGVQSIKIKKTQRHDLQLYLKMKETQKLLPLMKDNYRKLII